MANKEIKIQAGGREIVVRQPDVLAQLRLVDAIGESASNRVYLSMVLPLIYVAEIDGSPVPMPTTKREAEALFARLGEAGLQALNESIDEHFSRDAAAEVQSAKK